MFDNTCQRIFRTAVVVIPVMALFLGLGVPLLWESLGIPLFLSVALTIVEFLFFFILRYDGRIFSSLTAANLIITLIAGRHSSAQSQIILFIILMAAGLLGYIYQRLWDSREKD